MVEEEEEKEERGGGGGGGRGEGGRRRRRREEEEEKEEEEEGGSGGMKILKLSSHTGQQMNVEKHYQNHTVQVFILVARLLDSVMRATTFLWKPSLVR